jgi:DNA-binding NarL/FixJ family response regulator
MPPLDAAPEKPLRVLIVDGDDVFAGSLATILSADPRLEVVDRAANGAQGLMLAVDEQPDVVVLDVNMPILDGFTVGRLIRMQMPDVRIVIVSGAPECEHIAEARRAEADLYLRKDCGFDVLEEALVAGELGETQAVVTAG